jgi:Ca2+-binding RTX toxin-like protein
MTINYDTKNTFTLTDTSGDATYITGKGKSAQIVHEDLPLTPGYWEIHAGAGDDLIDARQSTFDVSLYGDTGNDTIYGSTGYYNHIEGGDGNDLIDARLVGTLNSSPSGGTDLLGGSGNDTIYGGWGEDFIDGGAGRDVIDAGAGDDRVIYDPNDIKVEGDGGRDTIDASTAAATNVRTGKGVTIDLSSNTDIFFNFEAVIGSKYNDTLKGDNADNWFDGGDGNDTINAGGGNDYVVYDAKDKSVDGGYDWDYLDAWNSSSAVTIDLATSTSHRNFEAFYGSRFDDVIKGTNGNNDLYGNDGNDAINGGAGFDYLTGDNGNDTLDGGAGGDNLYGGYGNDTYIYDAADYVDEYDSYRGGIDMIDASSAPAAVSIDMSDWRYDDIENLIGSTGNDNLTGNTLDNVIEGGGGADAINGGGHGTIGNTASYAGSTAAVAVDLGTGTTSGGDAAGDALSNIQNLIGSQGNDTLTGDAGVNLLEGGAGADTLDGVVNTYSGDVDCASYAGSAAGVTASLANPSNNTGDAAGDSYANIGGLVGSFFADILIGDGQDNRIVDSMLTYSHEYYSGSYSLFGKDDDWIDGGAGNDLIQTGAGNDTVVYDAADTQVIDYGDRDADGNSINTFDTVDASSSAGPVDINLNNNYTGFERIIGSTHDDTLTGNDADNVLEGGAGADALDGGYGSDTASYVGSAAAVTVDLGLGTANGGDAEGDTLSSIENLVGSANADTLTGDSYDNILEGGAGADALNGGDGSDTSSYAGSSAAVTVNLGAGTASGGDATGDTFTSIENLVGSSFNDTLTGDAGDNFIEGAGGADAMAGGSGIDTYVYKSVSESVEGMMDTISGFAWGSGGDVIDCSVALQANNHTDLNYYTAAFASFAQIKAEAEKQMWYGAEIFAATDGTDTYVFMIAPDDDKYDAGIDMAVKLAGVNDLSALSADNFHTNNYIYIYHIDG